MKEDLRLENPWELILSRPYLNDMALVYKDPQKRYVWSEALFEGGNTLRLWNEAAELKVALLAACALKNGQRILLTGKFCLESGLFSAVNSLLEPGGDLPVNEIYPKVLESLRLSGKLQWDFNYFDSLPEGSIDRVILFNAASHVKDWQACARKIHRVLQDNGRVIIAEAPWGGKELLRAARLDGHLYGILILALAGMGLKEADLPQTGPDDLRHIFTPLLRWNRTFLWEGLYLFYGEKGTKKNNAFFRFPVATKEVQAFLLEKQHQSPWDFLSDLEIAAIGAELTDINAQKTLGRVASFGPGLDWTYLKYQNIVKLMYENLKAAPGSRVLVIGEVLEGLGFLRSLREIIGETGEIASHEISLIHLAIFKRLWQGEKIPIENRHQYEYTFADKYPDNYFDLVWLPQGVHHARSWEETAPRLLRVLKPGGQIMMIESRMSNTDFFTAVNISGLMRCMAEKLWWSEGVTFEEMPDCPPEKLAGTFGDSLTETFWLDTGGWLVFWGYKK
ncbi:MAG: hypothetical protein A2Z15_05060 [Chloroflexi bacterium RBG_16_50_11]|nr:MAG: hypothetical protein A2Z15_05060 [Chloroflexi bacterium RBG_16_50_11]